MVCRPGVIGWRLTKSMTLRRKCYKRRIPMIGVTIPSKDYSPGCLAQPRCGFDEGVQHRLQVECRATNDLQHVRRRLQLTAESRNLCFVSSIGGLATARVERSAVLRRHHLATCAFGGSPPVLDRRRIPPSAHDKAAEVSTLGRSEVISTWAFQRMTNVAGGVISSAACRTLLGPDRKVRRQEVSSMTSLHTRQAAISSDLLPVSASRQLRTRIPRSSRVLP